VNAIVTGSTQAVSGLAMLNPQKWGANAETRARPVKQEDGEVVFEVTGVDDSDEKAPTELDVPATQPVSSPNLAVPGSATSASRSPSHSRSPSSTRATTPTPTSAPDPKSFDRLQLLVSLDTALELIHADRDSLKRCETFAKYPGKYGHRVREAMEEIFILMLKATGDKHIAPGFRM
jgi:recyclin-1